VDDLYETARAAGAIGGKLTGAGGGGFLLLFVPPERHADVREKLSQLVWVPFGLESGGSQVIFYDRERDYAELEADLEGRELVAFRELEDINAELSAVATPA
jgi:D-glycero-alpha-D-manno-heptose-7-phosphate kinase